jgi:serine/threonine-protein kinase
VLNDFGIARTGVDTGSEVHTSVMSGSPAYMAPEQFYGRTSPASDIFSLGSTAFEMLRGIPLHKCGSKEMMQRTARLELGKMQPPVPESVREAIAKALAPDPDKRFQSARDFGKALAEAPPVSSSANRGAACCWEGWEQCL